MSTFFATKRNAQSRSGTVRRGGGAASKAYVRKAIRNIQEKKFHLYADTDVDLSYDNPVFQSITDISQGDLDSNRDGDRLKLRSVDVRGMIIGNNGVTTEARVLVVQWLGQDTPTVQEILEAGTVAWNADTAVTAHYNHDHRKMFRVLYDRTIVSCSTATTTSAGSNEYKRWLFHARINIGKLALKGKAKAYINYQSASTTGNNKVYIMALSNQTDASGFEPTLTYEAKVNFTDS